MAAQFPFPIPEIPDVEGRLPFIWRQFVDPCDAPITVWVEAIGGALIHALIFWFAVDLLQIFRVMFKPPIYALRTRTWGHGRRGGSSKKRGFWHKFKGIVGFDYNDWIGKELNVYSTTEMVCLFPGEIWFWSGIELITRAGYYWAVVDVSTRFLYEWTSAVSNTKYCHARDDASLYASAPGYPLLGIFGWDAVGILTAEKMRNIDFFNGFGVAQSVNRGVFSLIFSYKCTETIIPDPWIRARVTCLTGPRAGSYAERLVGEGFPDEDDTGITYDMAPGEVWIGEIRVNGSYNIIAPAISCYARGSP